MEPSLKELIRSIRRLEERIARLEEKLIGSQALLTEALAARGLTVFAHNPVEKTLLPEGVDTVVETRFYQLLKRYSFRLYLRDAMKQREGFMPDELTRYCSLRTARAYGKALLELGLVEPKGELLCFKRYQSSFGPTLEWLVAKLFEEEFLAPASYGVRFRGTRTGGDFDVIAWIDGNLVYTEVKSSPPKGIEVAEVRAFLKRSQDLKPEVSIFFVDTRLRMKDKIVVLFEQVLGEDTLVRMRDELFRAGHSTFIVNANREIATNLRCCLRHFASRAGQS